MEAPGEPKYTREKPLRVNVNDPRAIRPQDGRQWQFLTTRADICIYGGAAGGGKTWGLLLEAARNVNNKDYGGVIFRQSHPQIVMEGGLWDESMKIYPQMKGTPFVGSTSWRWPSGARVRFGYINSEQDKLKWMGSQIPMIGWDQLEHFNEATFWYMLSRNRSMSGVRPYVRATVNPDADSWVANLCSWWIDMENTGLPILSRAGVLRYFIRVNGELVWSDDRDELANRYKADASDIKSLTFIPATIYDNKKLLDRDPGYLSNLKALPLLDRERLFGGNWKIRAEAGKVFNRAWFKLANEPFAGSGVIECRGFDFAATLKKSAGDDPDFTASTKMQYQRGQFKVVDSTEERIAAGDLDRYVVNLVMQDMADARRRGAFYMMVFEVEPGSAGIREAVRMKKMLPGVPVYARPPVGDKIQRAKNLASKAEAGLVEVLNQPWSQRFISHLHNVPDGPHDDVLDSATITFNEIVDHYLPLHDKQTSKAQLIGG